MRVRVRSPRDFWSGAIFIVAGAAAALLARAYPMGTAMRMGPGYFPTVLGILLAVLGTFVLLRSLVRPGPLVGRPTFGPIGLVVGPIVLFGLLLLMPRLFSAAPPDETEARAHEADAAATRGSSRVLQRQRVEVSPSARPEQRELLE